MQIVDATFRVCYFDSITTSISFGIIFANQSRVMQWLVDVTHIMYYQSQSKRPLVIISINLFLESLNIVSVISCCIILEKLSQCIQSVHYIVFVLYWRFESWKFVKCGSWLKNWMINVVPFVLPFTSAFYYICKCWTLSKWMILFFCEVCVWSQIQDLKLYKNLFEYFTMIFFKNFLCSKSN